MPSQISNFTYLVHLSFYFLPPPFLYSCWQTQWKAVHNVFCLILLWLDVFHVSFRVRESANNVEQLGFDLYQQYLSSRAVCKLNYNLNSNFMILWHVVIFNTPKLMLVQKWFCFISTRKQGWRFLMWNALKSAAFSLAFVHWN